MFHSSIAKFCVPWNQISLNLCRRIVRMRKSSYLWNIYALEMDSSPSSNSLRRWMWMGRMPTLSSSSSGKSCLPPATTRALCFPTPSWSSGVPSAGTTLPGTLRSSSSGPTASPSSATAGNSWRAASRATSRSCWARQTDAFHANPSHSIHVSSMVHLLRCIPTIFFSQLVLTSSRWAEFCPFTLWWDPLKACLCEGISDEM